MSRMNMIENGDIPASHAIPTSRNSEIYLNNLN